MGDPAREWQATFDAIRDPVAVLDGTGRRLRCNRAWKALGIDEALMRALVDAASISDAQ